MAATPEIPVHFPDTFEQMINDLTQQESTIIPDGAFMQVEANGRRFRYHQAEASTLINKTWRNQQTQQQVRERLARWLIKSPFYTSELMDEFDAERLAFLATDTRSEFARSQAKAVSRQKDVTKIDALLGTTVTGENGTGTETFDTTNNQIAADVSGSTTNMDFFKLLTVRDLLRNNWALQKGEPIWVALNSSQITSILNNVNEAKNTDFIQAQTIIKGEMIDGEFLNMNFLVFGDTNRSPSPLPLNGTVRTCVAWTSGALKYADTGVESMIDILPTQEHSTQFRTRFMDGASRTEQDLVFSFLCDENVV